jgi:tetratricopeptide (TPR) repeat protein
MSPQAIEELRAAAKLNPQSGSVQWKLARAWRAAKKYDEAIQAGQEAVRLEPQSALAHNALALARNEHGNYLDDAIAEYREAARLAPNDAVAHANLGYALFRKKAYAEAAEAYRAAVKFQPTNATYQLRLANSLRLARQFQPVTDASRSPIWQECGSRSNAPCCPTRSERRAGHGGS